MLRCQGGSGGSRVGNYSNDFASPNLGQLRRHLGQRERRGDLLRRDPRRRRKALNGSDSYVIHFPADQLPQSAVDAYRSVILVGLPDYRVVDNPHKCYNFNRDLDQVMEVPLT
jgi:hypothetical protein